MGRNLARGDARVGGGVVIAIVDALRGAILLAGNFVTVGGGEMPVIGGAHVGLLLVQLGLVGVSVGGALGGDLAVGDALVDAGLLARVAGVDGVALVVGGGLCAGEGGGEGQGTKGCGDEKRFQSHCGCLSVRRSFLGVSLRLSSVPYSDPRMGERLRETAGRFLSLCRVAAGLGLQL